MSKTIEPHILKEYSLIREMGSGAYGHVWQIKQKKTDNRYALKKIFDAFRNSIDAQRTYREIQILHQLKHENIVKLHKVKKANNNKDLYLIFQYMEADLHSVVGTDILEKVHQVYIFHQILKALKYLHSAQLIHRDLKPSNILINSQCLIKLCDFGLIRSLANNNKNQQIVLSQQVATKWYRAPQLLLGSRSYHKPVDMWSFGCIVAQLLTGKPLFAGTSTLNQLEKILQYTGQIHQIDIESLESPVAEQLISQIKIRKKSFRDYFTGVDSDFYQLIKGLIQLNPNKRLSVDQALQLDLFKDFRGQQLHISQKAIIPGVDDNHRLDIKIYRQKIYQDINLRYRNNNSSIKKKLSKTSNNIKSQPNIKNRSNSKQKSLKKTQIIYKSYSNHLIKKNNKNQSISYNSNKINNPYLKDNNNIIKKYQIKKSPDTKIIKKNIKNRLNQIDKKSILKNLGFQKSKNFYKYIH